MVFPDAGVAKDGNYFVFWQGIRASAGWVVLGAGIWGLAVLVLLWLIWRK